MNFFPGRPGSAGGAAEKGKDGGKKCSRKGGDPENVHLAARLGAVVASSARTPIRSLARRSWPHAPQPCAAQQATAPVRVPAFDRPAPMTYSFCVPPART